MTPEAKRPMLAPDRHPLSTVLSEPLASLERRAAAALRGRVHRLGVAFSGGVDSTVLLALAARALKAENVVAIVGVSASLAARERQDTHELSSMIGVQLVEVATEEGSLPEYQRNGLDRCFHCKHTLFQTIEDEVLAVHRLDAVAYGETADDLRRSDRPGAAAASKHAVLRPLADAGLAKSEIRALAHALGLPNAAKPAAPCLASRIPHGMTVTPAKLARVERAEDALLRLGFGDSRVRDYGAVACVELPEDQLVALASAPTRQYVLDAVRAAGYRVVTMNLAGLASGSLHQLGRLD